MFYITCKIVDKAVFTCFVKVWDYVRNQLFILNMADYVEMELVIRFAVICSIQRKHTEKIKICFLRTDIHILFRENWTQKEPQIPRRIYSRLVICSFILKILKIVDLVFIVYLVLVDLVTMAVKSSDVLMQGISKQTQCHQNNENIKQL